MSLAAWALASMLLIGLLFGVNYKGKIDGRAERDADVRVLEARGDDKDAEIARQNSAISAMKAESDKRAAAADSKLRAAQTATAAGQDNIARILASQSSGNACADAEALIRKEMGGARE